MTSHDLLVKASRAAGLGDDIWSDIDGNLYTGPPERAWNPLENDGDAFNLVVSLGMVLHVTHTFVSVEKRTPDAQMLTMTMQFSPLYTKAECVRRSITGLAAAMADDQ